MTVEGCDLPINTFLYTIILEIIMKRLQQCMFSGVGVQNPSASLSADGLGYSLQISDFCGAKPFLLLFLVDLGVGVSADSSIVCNGRDSGVTVCPPWRSSAFTRDPCGVS